MESRSAGSWFQKPGVASLTTGAIAGLVSAFSSPSYDEGLWLAVTRRMDLGARLYSDLIDNKTPPVYWVTRALDHAPGPFPAARGALFGALIAAIVAAAIWLAHRLGVEHRTSVVLAIFIGALSALQSVFVLNIETPVILLLMVGLALITYDRVVLGSIVAALAATFDVRALAFLPAVAVFSRRGGPGRALRSVAAWVVVAGAWSLVILANPRLRYSIVELNASTRGTLASWRPFVVLAVIVVAMAPLLVTVALRWRAGRDPLRTLRSTPAGLLLLVTALGIGVASRYPFLKYWILVAPAIVLFAAVPESIEVEQQPIRTFTAPAQRLIVVSFLPLLALVVSTEASQRTLVSRYEVAARSLGRLLQPEDRFVSFDPQPFITTFQPRHAALPWATLDYLGVKTSHRGQDLKTISDAIDHAVAVVDDGALSAAEGAIDPRFREVWRLYHDKLDSFPCRMTIQQVTIRLRPDRCP